MAILGHHLATTSAADGRDLYDVGVVQLPRVIEWEIGMAPLTFSRTRIPRVPLPLPTIHAIAGLPSTKMKPNFAEGYFDTELVGLFEMAEPIDRQVELGYRPDHHIIIPFTQKRQRKFTDSVRAAPDPKGRSGSPIWNLHNDRGLLRPVLGGIATAHLREERVIVGIRIEHALQMIDQLEAESASS
jgi:hypothetical protein